MARTAPSLRFAQPSRSWAAWSEKASSAQKRLAAGSARGLPIFLALVLLLAGVYALPAELSYACLAGLAMLWVGNPSRGRQ